MKKTVLKRTGVARASIGNGALGFAPFGDASAALARSEVQPLPPEGAIRKRRDPIRAQMVRTILIVMALAVTGGCSAFHGRVSGKSWNQTAAKEQREQEIGGSPAGDWDFAPR